MNDYLKLAKEAIETYLKTGKIISPASPARLAAKRAGGPASTLPAEFKRQAGVFVSIHEKSGELRGCIGTFLPTRKNLAEELIYNSIASATEDPRFPPIQLNELPDLEFSVDILSTPKSAQKKDLNPKKYGLIVKSSNGRQGLLLPDLEGVDSVEKQISICCQKAGISPNEPVSFQIFTVERHK